MPPPPLPLVQGTLDLLVLRTLAPGPMHGYGIATAGPRANRRRPGHRRRRALPGAPSARPPGPGRGRVAAVGEQPARALLHADTGRAQAVARGDGQLAAVFARGRGRAAGRQLMKPRRHDANATRSPPAVLVPPPRTRRPCASEVDEELTRSSRACGWRSCTAGGLPPDEARREALRQFGDLEAHPAVLPAAGSGEGEAHATRIDARGSDAGPPDLPSKPAAGSDDDDDDRGHGRPRHRRDDRDLQRRLRGSATPAAVRRSRPARADLHRRASVQVPVLGRRLPRAAGAADALRADRRRTPIAPWPSATATWPSGSGDGSCRGRTSRCSASGPRSAATSREADGRPGSPPAVIVSHGFWQQRLGGRADVDRQARSGSMARTTRSPASFPSAGPAGAASGVLRRRAVGHAAAQGPLFLSRRWAACDRASSDGGRGGRAARDQPAHLSRSGELPTRMTRRRGA